MLFIVFCIFQRMISSLSIFIRGFRGGRSRVRLNSQSKLRNEQSFIVSFIREMPQNKIGASRRVSGFLSGFINTLKKSLHFNLITASNLIAHQIL